MEQQSLFDNAPPINEPRYKTGDAIYQVVLDVIKPFVIAGNFSLGADVYGERTEAGQTLWRYHLDRVNSGGHSVFGEYEMGDIWFDDLAAAESLAAKNKAAIESSRFVIRADKIHTHDEQAFLHKNADGKELLAAVARVGKVAVYDKAPYCYPFLYVFKTETKANAYFDKALREASEKALGSLPFRTEDLYRVTDEKWSSYECAERHGDWSCLGKEPKGHQLKKEKNRARER